MLTFEQYMGYTMRITEWFTPANPCERFKTNEELFNALQRLDSAAILCVQIKAMPSVRKFMGQYGLSMDKTDDIINQSTMIFLQKITSGAYLFQGHNPSTYLIEIARRVSLMSTRSNRHPAESLEDHQYLHDDYWETDNQRRESAELVSQLLDQLGQPCAEVIKLHHIDGYSDEEVIRLGMTRYTTIDSLKMKRSDCMKKLIQLAQKWKITNLT